ncbi:hypothetical protein Hokovirus_3_190 [Hokovirus HKV1]|uniref:NUDIX hydrolase n=1 Tax=Hokovirus HKV1 TaxID=1977638 RepID=A0A1V0SGS5_9VIRU|nr:hypothetical protein Hokovirus_3_190 [Hokovirus HKV1]
MSINIYTYTLTMSCSKCSNLCKNIPSIKPNGGAGVLFLTNDNNNTFLILGKERGGNYQGLFNIGCGKMDSKDGGCHIYTAWREFHEEIKYYMPFNLFLQQITGYIVFQRTPIFILTIDNVNVGKLDKLANDAINTPSLDWCLQEMSEIKKFNVNNISNDINISSFTKAVFEMFCRGLVTNINNQHNNNNNNNNNNNIQLNSQVSHNLPSGLSEEIRIIPFNMYQVRDFKGKRCGKPKPTVLAFPNGPNVDTYGFPCCKGNNTKVDELMKQFNIPLRCKRQYYRIETDTKIIHANIILCNGLSRNHFNDLSPEWFVITDILEGNDYLAIQSIHDNNKYLSLNSSNIVEKLVNVFLNI